MERTATRLPGVDGMSDPDATASWSDGARDAPSRSMALISMAVPPSSDRADRPPSPTPAAARHAASRSPRGTDARRGAGRRRSSTAAGGCSAGVLGHGPPRRVRRRPGARSAASPPRRRRGRPGADHGGTAGRPTRRRPTAPVSRRTPRPSRRRRAGCADSVPGGERRRAQRRQPGAAVHRRRLRRGTFGPYLQTLMKKTGMVDVTLDYKVSSGLARPDFFDWPARFAEEMPEGQPGHRRHHVRRQRCAGSVGQVRRRSSSASRRRRQRRLPGGGEEYGKRVGAVMDELTQGGRTLIWVGIPNDDNPEVTARMAVQDSVVREQVATHPGVVFVDTWQMFSGRNGGWADFVDRPRATARASRCAPRTASTSTPRAPRSSR